MMFWPFTIVAANMAARKAQKQAQQAKMKEKHVVHVARPPIYRPSGYDPSPVGYRTAPVQQPDPFPSTVDMFALGQMLGESSKVQNTECSVPAYTPSYDDSSSRSSSYDSGSSSSSYDSGSSYDSSSSCDSSSSSGSYD